jgi:hypothetical protein
MQFVKMVAEGRPVFAGDHLYLDGRKVKIVGDSFDTYFKYEGNAVLIKVGRYVLTWTNESHIDPEYAAICAARMRAIANSEAALHDRTALRHQIEMIDDLRDEL